MNALADHLALILITLLGLCAGSFLNVVIYRVPRRQSVIFPSSRCPQCSAAIAFYDNLPLLSYLLLLGKCRRCKKPISWRYPAIELLTASLFAMVFYKDGLQGILAPDLLFTSSMLALIFIDAEHKILPNVIIYPLFAILLAARAVYPDSFSEVQILSPAELASLTATILALAAIVAAPLILLGVDYGDWILIGKKLPPASEDGADDEVSYGKHVVLASVLIGVALSAVVAFLIARGVVSGAAAFTGATSALVGGVMTGGIFWLLRLMYFALKRREGMGLGDAKMMMMVGGFIGWKLGFLTTFVGALAGSLIAGGYIMLRRRDTNTEIPFGVFLGMGALFALFYGQRAIELWLGMLG